MRVIIVEVDQALGPRTTLAVLIAVWIIWWLAVAGALAGLHWRLTIIISLGMVPPTAIVVWATVLPFTIWVRVAARLSYRRYRLLRQMQVLRRQRGEQNNVDVQAYARENALLRQQLKTALDERDEWRTSSEFWQREARRYRLEPPGRPGPG